MAKPEPGEDILRPTARAARHLRQHPGARRTVCETSEVQAFLEMELAGLEPATS